MKSKTILLFLGAVLIMAGIVVFIIIPAPAPEESSAPESTIDIEGVNFNFPQTLDKDYISTVDWPPVVRVDDSTYSCTEAGEETARAGKTSEQVINSHTYCVTVVSEGAAGSIYRTYTYNFAYDNQNVFVTFSLRFPQCANYPEIEQADCKTEQNLFEVGELVDRVVMDGLGRN